LTDKSRKQVADEMSISVHTASQYVKILYRALGVRSRAELMTLVFKPDAAKPRASGREPEGLGGIHTPKRGSGTPHTAIVDSRAWGEPAGCGRAESSAS